MADTLQLSLLYFVTCIIKVFAGDKALIVSTFPNWIYDAQFNIYHGDPSNFVTDQVTGVSKTTIGADAQVTSIVANTQDQTLFFLDATSNSLYKYENFSLYMNHTYQQFSTIHTGVSATTSQIAYDWLAKNIYWTDGFYKWIATHPVDKIDEDLSLYKILVKDYLTKPEGITLDPYKRYMFWSDVINSKSKIERSSLTGENRKVIVNSDTPIWISSLAVDTKTEMLYWADIGRQTIEIVDYEGTLTSRKVLSRVLGANFLSLSIGTDVICATEYKYLYIMCFDKTTGNNTWFTSYTYQEPWGIAVYDEDVQQIVSHPCSGKNCEHMCFNIDDNTARCECKEGFKLQSDGVSCQSELGFLFGNGIILTNETDVCMYDTHIITQGKKTPHCFLTNLTGVMHIAVDSHDKKLYYVDRTHSIKQIDMVNTMEKDIYFDSSGSAEISGLALDWTTKNLYWSDKNGGKIVVHSLVTSTTADLITLLSEPAFVTVNPHDQKLYWQTGDGISNGVQAASLDGSNKMTVLQTGELSYSEGLFYDVRSKRLFLVDSGDILSMNTDGTKRVYHAYSGYTTHLLIYKEYALWTIHDSYMDIAHLDSFFADVSFNADYMGSISAIGIYDTTQQPMQINNCTNFNGGCQHICEPTKTSSVCICNFGYKLQSDRKSCSNEPFYDSFAIIADVTHDRLYQVSLSDAEIRALDIPEVNVPVSVIYDKPTEKIYWSNAVRTEIRASQLKSAKSELIYDTWSTLPVGLAFDYSTGLLYFSTEYWYSPSYIACIHPHVGKKHTLIENLDLPKNIALYPAKGLMFYADISTSDSRSSYIGSAFMDGTNVNKIVETDINSPNGIVIDFASDRLYWADADLSRISSCKLDGTGRKIVIEEADAGIVGLDISPPYMYYVGRNKQRISKYDMTNQVKMSFMQDIHAFGRIESIKVYPEQSQPVSPSCKNNGGCSLFCLPTPTGRTCGCEDGESLESDGKKCTGHISCSTRIPNAILDNRCIGHSTGSCNFTCATGYNKTVDVLECSENGNWNNPIHTVCQSLTGTCNKFIPNGHVSTNCDSRIGSECSYECNAGYVPNESSATITCGNSGAWSKPIESLCKMSVSNIYCPESIKNGQLSTSCTRSPGSQCDFSCNSGYNKNTAVTALVCLSEGVWNVNGELCLAESTVKCPAAVLNGAFGVGCSFRVKSSCPYTCNTGYNKNPTVSLLTCMVTGNWNFDPRSLCSEDQDGTVIVPQKQVAEGASSGTVAGVVIAAIVITILIVIVIIYFVWWRKRPAGQLMADSNLKFKRFNDTNIPIDSGVGGFSNPIAQQPDYGNFSNCREEGYVTAEINPRYQNADPSDVNVTVSKTPSKNGGIHSDA